MHIAQSYLNPYMNIEISSTICVPNVIDIMVLTRLSIEFDSKKF